ncbi:Uncharacterised protein [Mycobacteroides abscessus subsp. abscessus]|uniref:Uncharacterized protein n=5 Tax=Mycobacteroides TaxID=670516 RepID=A0AB74FEE7_9MYCO|nr:MULTISPECIES: hypothetical protein [Mycobacteroides]EUA71022.1 hypothetical protein I540_3349 [Mycobacteroides abscessus subsp. bolletii 1513]AKP58920.1 hypothetical protein MAUC22_16110 [Mycobacteroides abscessus UC22]AMU26711.1 hypothetical protein A3N96_16045 [Mycobacteroides abscessus]AMU36393.1 hypothetical protein A3N98_15240 [Mycobacteroides abscessus]AMU41441.1 hypothetical protein A3N99_15835 [Mycobacteroides abscessus]
MALTYTLLVDNAEKYSDTFPDADALAADASHRAAAFGSTVGANQLATDIKNGFTSIDLRLSQPAVTVQVRAA